MRNIFVTLICLLPFAMYAFEANPKPDEKPHEIVIEIKVSCPMSSELKDFMESIPPVGNYSSSYEEWQSSFSNNMRQLMKLIESKKVYSSYWSVKTDDALSQDTQ